MRGDAKSSFPDALFQAGPPNGLRFSCAAPLDRNHGRAESAFQKRPDLGAAQRRQLQAPVGPRHGRSNALQLRFLYSSPHRMALAVCEPRSVNSRTRRQIGPLQYSWLWVVNPKNFGRKQLVQEPMNVVSSDATILCCFSSSSIQRLEK